VVETAIILLRIYPEYLRTTAENLMVNCYNIYEHGLVVFHVLQKLPGIQHFIKIIGIKQVAQIVLTYVINYNISNIKIVNNNPFYNLRYNRYER